MPYPQNIGSARDERAVRAPPSRGKRISLSKTHTITGLVTAVLLAMSALSIGAVGSADTVTLSLPGANDFSCVPSAQHPYPVILVPGTFESTAKNWSTLAPYLKKRRYFVYSHNYGTKNGVDATAPVADSAAELAVFVDTVLAVSGAGQVELVGHSQGGMMPRYYLGFLGGAPKVHHLIGLAPSNHRTDSSYIPLAPVPTGGAPLSLSTTPPSTQPSTQPSTPPSTPAFTTGGHPTVPNPCAACDDQAAGSDFMTMLNSIGDVVDGPSYTVISTVNDEIVRPYTSQALAGPANWVTNIVIQDLCPLDQIEHDQAPNDPVVHRLVEHALAQPTGPADSAFRPACV